MRKIRVFQSNAYLSLDYQAKTGEMYTLDDNLIGHEEVPIDDHDALEKELDDFLRCAAGAIETGIVPEPQVSGEHAQKALEIAVEITRQAMEGTARAEALKKSQA